MLANPKNKRMDDRERERGDSLLDEEARLISARLHFLRNIPGQDAHEETVSPENCGIDPDEEWKANLITRLVHGKMVVLPRAHNLLLILEHAPHWKGRLRLDEFRQCIVDRDVEWTDALLIETKAWLERRWIDGGDLKTSLVREAVETIAARHPFHPVREWLAGLVWDGEDRLSSFFSDYCGTPLTAYTSAVARSFFVSAVARVLRPGCKVDTMVVLEGNQGIGKSRLVQTLFDARWHCDITCDPGSLDFYQTLRGKWIGEFSELSAMGKADQNKVKQAITQTQDTYRASYAHYACTYPRQFIFVGNTNKAEYLVDETGARRYLPIECVEINIEAIHSVRDQLWAEAVVRFQQGEKWWDIPDSEREQESRYQYDSWRDYIEPWLVGKTKVLISEVLEGALGLKPERHDRSMQTRVGAILRRLHWAPKRDCDGERKRYYVKMTKMVDKGWT